MVSGKMPFDFLEPWVQSCFNFNKNVMPLGDPRCITFIG